MPDPFQTVQTDRGPAEPQPVTLVMDGEVMRSVQTDGERDLAFREGRKFYATTGLRDIAAGETLEMRITNPAESGRNIIIRYRSFTNDRQGADKMLERAITVDDADMSVTPTPALPMNGAGLLSSASVIEISVGAPVLTPGPFRETMPLNGIPERIDGAANDYLIAPGQAAAYIIFGDDAPGRASITYIWEEWDA